MDIDPGGATEQQIRQHVAALASAAGSMRALAREWGVDPSYLSDFLNGRRGPGPKILGPLGLVVAETRYVAGPVEGKRKARRGL